MPTFHIILVEPKYQGNIGAVARVMKNFGFNNLVLVKPPELGGEARAMAMHAQDILESAKIVHDFHRLKEKFDFLIATSSVIASDKNPYRTPIFPEHLENSLRIDGDIGIVFGREDHGLLNDEIDLCDILLSIPTSKEYPALNLSHSVAIILYELSKQQKREEIKHLKKFQETDRITKEILLKNFDKLVDILFVDKREFSRRITKKTFRQLLGRAFISSREVSTLIGFFRRANERIRKE